MVFRVQPREDVLPFDRHDHGTFTPVRLIDRVVEEGRRDTGADRTVEAELIQQLLVVVEYEIAVGREVDDAGRVHGKTVVELTERPVFVVVLEREPERI